MHAGRSSLTVPISADVSTQLVDPRSVRRHNDPYDLVTLAQQVQQVRWYDVILLLSSAQHAGCVYTPYTM